MFLKTPATHWKTSFHPAVLLAAALSLGACANISGAPSASTPTLSRERIAEIVNSPDRSAADRNNDLRRKPADMLAFIGIRPGMVAFDLSTGGGYTTELLARAVGPSGKAYGQSQPPRDPSAPARPTVAPEGNAAPQVAPTPGAANAPPAVRRTSAQALAERSKNPVVANIVSVVRKFEDPIPPELASGGLDLVTLMFDYHDFGTWGWTARP